MIRRLSTQWIYLLLPLLLSACQGTPTTPKKDQTTVSKPLIHQDSTIYFANKTASISMRASFTNTGGGTEQALATGYKLQFRSIQEGNVSISQVSIIAGGKKITLNEQGFLLPPNQGATLSINLEDTRYITGHPDATLRFKYEGESQLMSIKQHRLSEFAP